MMQDAIAMGVLHSQACLSSSHRSHRQMLCSHTLCLHEETTHICCSCTCAWPARAACHADVACHGTILDPMRYQHSRFDAQHLEHESRGNEGMTPAEAYRAEQCCHVIKQRQRVSFRIFEGLQAQRALLKSRNNGCWAQLQHPIMIDEAEGGIHQQGRPP